MDHLRQLEQASLRKETVEAAYASAPDIADKVLEYTETGLKVVQLAAAVLGVVHFGAKMFSSQKEAQRVSTQPQAHSPSVPPPLPVVSVSEHDALDRLTSTLGRGTSHEQVHQGPPPPVMSASGRLF